MGTPAIVKHHPRQQARPFAEDHDLEWLGLLILIVSAAIVVGALWLGLSFLLSLRAYIPTLP